MLIPIIFAKILFFPDTCYMILLNKIEKVENKESQNS